MKRICIKQFLALAFSVIALAAPRSLRAQEQIPPASGFSAGGDLSGTSTSQTVVGINGTALSGLATGLLKNTHTTGVPSIATSSDVISLFSGTCSSSTELRGDGSCGVPAAGIAVSTGSAWGGAATWTTIIGLFSGTCSSSTYLRGDGSCSTPSGSGNVSTSGSPAQYQTAVFTNSTTIAGIGPGTSGYPLVSGGASANPSFAQLSLTAGVSGILPVANGGTNASSAASALVSLFPAGTRVGDILYCSAYTSSACTTWSLLAGNTGSTAWLQETSGGAPSWTTPSGSGNVSTSGSPAQYQTPVWASSTTVAGIGPGTSGYPLVSGGASANPSYAQLSLTAGVSGTLPVANGGTGTGSTLTGLVRGSASAMTAAELSGDVTTSGSNAATVVQVEGAAIPASAFLVGTNSSKQLVAAQPFVVNAQTSTYQVVASDFSNCKTIPVASGTFTITLVASGSQPASGQCINVFNYGSGVVTIARSGQNINGGTASITLNAASASAPTSANIVSDGTNYEATIDEGTVGTVTSIATTSPITGGTITGAGTIACATCVVASSPGAGIAHFAGSTQTVTSSAVSLSADVSGQLPIGNVGSSGLSGTAPITISSAGAIACATCDTSASSLTSNAVVVGGGGQAEATISADTTTTHALFATAGSPAFRAIATTDLPAIPLSSGVSGTLPVANGGTGTGSTLTGLVRGSASAMTAAELSGDVTTSGSNAATVVQVEGAAIPASAFLVGTNSSKQLVAAQPFVVNAQTSTYQVVASDFSNCKTIPVASGTFTITLVASGSQPASGQCINVFNYGSGVVTIARSGQNINGGTASITLNAASASAPTSANIVSDGTNYEATIDEGTVGTVTTSGSPAQYQTAVFSSSTAVTGVSPSATSGVPFVSGGSSANPSFGTAVVAGGGTGATTAAAALVNLLPAGTRVGDILYCSAYTSSACTTWSLVAGNNSGTAWLQETSAGAPSWTTPSGGSSSFPLTVSGTVNSGGIPYFSNSTTETSSAALTAYGVLFGGGAGGAPTASAQGAANMPLIGQGASNPIFSTIAYPTSCTSGGWLYGSSTTAIACGSLVTSNVIPKSGGAGNGPAASSLSDNGTTVSTSEPVVTTSSVSFGSSPPAATAGTAGALALTEGTACTNVSGAACIYPDSTAHEYRAFTNGATSNPGLMVRSQPGSIASTSQTASISTATLCAASAGACNVAGQYEVHFDFWGGGTACSTVTAGKVTFNLTWTDPQGNTHSAIPLMDMDQKSAGAAVGFFFNTSLATEGAGGIFDFSTNGTIIQYSTTYTACTSGTGTYYVQATVTRLW
jgi:hypothetical protein